MYIRSIIKISLLTLLFLISAVSFGSEYVGSFRVQDGEYWPENPPVYTAQEAAALLFGGDPTDYAISIDSNTTDPSTITNTAWVSIWGGGCHTRPEDYKLDIDPAGYNAPGGSNTAASAYVYDHCRSNQTNYVWSSLVENTAPTISSNDTASVPENQTAAIDVQSDDDVDSENSGLTYSKTGGADKALFNLDANTGVLTFMNVPDFEVPGDADGGNDYEVHVTVTDSGGLADVQDIVITVTDVFENTAPTITSNNAVSVPENQTAALDVQSDDDVDNESSGLTYSKTGGVDKDLFNLDANSGVLTFMSEPDFEIPGDVDGGNDYEVQVTVTDSGGLTDVKNFVISVFNELDGTDTDLAAIFLNSGFLILQGTTVSDHFVVTGTGSGSVSVTDGANDGASVGDFENVTGLRLNGKQGENHFTLHAVDLGGASLEINSGGSDDTVLIEDLLSVDDLDIDLAGGNNLVTAADATVTIAVAGNASIEANQGVDMVVIPNITTGNHFDIDLGGGDDKTMLGVGGTVMIGNRLTVNSSYGDNEAVLEGVQVTNVVQLFSGDGIDDYELTNMVVGSFLDLFSGPANDGVMSDSNQIAGEYNVNCGPGDQDSFVSTNDQGSPLVHNQCEIVP